MAEYEDYWGDAAWSDRERSMWGGVGGEDSPAHDDRTAQTLFHEAYFNFDVDPDTRDAIREALDSYLQMEYGIDFNDTFDWELYREMYTGD